MAWTLGGTRIFVQKISEAMKAIIAELNPLRTGSVYQTFGWEGPKYQVAAIIVGDADKEHLKSLTASGASYFELVAPEGSLGNYYVKGVDTDRQMVISQTMRPDLDCDAPVYNVDIDLIQVWD